MNTYKTITAWSQSREIVKRLVITGTLTLLAPTHLGNGDPSDPIENSLLLDSITGQPLLTGTSIAGALRSYLYERLCGYPENNSKKTLSNDRIEKLFGPTRGSEEGNQSLLITEDALGTLTSIEIRDGVRIDPKTGTAMIEEKDGKKSGYKFDMEFLSAGTTFPLRFELIIPEGEEEELKQTLAIALQGFQKSEITLGARKSRGFGKCKVDKWQVLTYDLTTANGLFSWLDKNETVNPSTGTDIANLLGIEDCTTDKRDYLTLECNFRLNGSLLIRADSENGADSGHLHSYRPGTNKSVPVLPGTSLAGVLRHRALQIVNTLHPEQENHRLIEELFGKSPNDNDDKEELTASRVTIEETMISETQTLIQNRVKIDRFTGGAYPTALFNEEPLFGGPKSNVKIALTLRNPKEHEIGLLLFLLKDLWTGDLTIGGERSIGRGILEGKEATLSWYQGETRTAPLTWELKQSGDNLTITGDKEQLEKFANALNTYQGEANND